MYVHYSRSVRFGIVATIAGIAVLASFATRAQANSTSTAPLPMAGDHIAESNYLAQRFGTGHSGQELVRAQSHIQAMPAAAPLPGIVSRSSTGGMSVQSNGTPGGRWSAIGPNSIDTTQGNSFFIGQTGPNSGRTLAIVSDPTTSGANTVLYIGTQAGGVWKSVNNGQSWVPLTDNMPVLSIDALVMDPTNHLTLYAATGENDHSQDSGYGIGVYKTTNGGVTWSILGGTNPLTNPFITGAGTNYKFSALVIDPNNHNVLYGGTNHGLWKYDNSTGAWAQNTAVTLPGLPLTISDVAIDGNSNPSTLYVADVDWFGGSPLSGVYKSIDGGATWTDLTPALISSIPSGYNAGGVTWTDRHNIGRTTIALAPSNHQVLYAAPSDPGSDLYGTDPGNPLVGLVFKSVNGGATWTTYQNVPDVQDGAHAPGAGQAWYDLYLHVDPANPNIAYLGGVNIARTLDGGATWTDITHVYDSYPSPVHPDQHNMWFGAPVGSGPSPFYAVNDGGVYSSADGGNTWVNLNNNLNTLESYVTNAGLNFVNQPLAWSGMQDNGTNRYTGNMEWANLFGGDGGYTAIDPTNQKTVYEEYVYLSIYKSTDGGFNWNGSTTGITSLPIINRGPIVGTAAPLFIAPYIMDPNALYSNATAGYTPPPGGPTPAHAWNLHLLAGSTFLYETLDGAATWCPLNATEFTASISSIAIAPETSQPNAETMYVGLTNGQVWQTTNGYVTANAATTPGTPNCVATSTWTEIDNGQILGASGRLPYIASIAVDPVDPTLLYVGSTYGDLNYSLVNAPHTWVSKGGGVYTWTAMDGSGAASLPILNAEAMLAYKSSIGTVVVVGMDTGVYFSVNPGNQANPYWVPLGGIPNSPIDYLSTDAEQTTILAATKGRGTWVMPIPQLTPNQMGSGDTIGIFYNQSGGFGTGVFELSNSITTGHPDTLMPDGSNIDSPVVGDWLGQGTVGIGVYRPPLATFILKDSTAPLVPATHVFTFGYSGTIPIAGDWTGSGHKTVGVYDPTKGVFYLRNSLSTGFADETVVFGPKNGLPVVGHWDGTAVDHVGVYSNGVFYLTASYCGVGATCVGSLYKAVNFGAAADLPVVGDWSHSGATELGVYRPSNGVFYLCTSPTQTCANADVSTVWQNPTYYGVPLLGGTPIAGHWNNSGNPFMSPSPTILVAKTPSPAGSGQSGSVPGDNQIGG